MKRFFVFFALLLSLPLVFANEAPLTTPQSITFENCTKPLLNTEDYRYDISLKGEFIRTVLDAGLPEELRDRVLLCGLQALAGEEITE